MVVDKKEKEDFDFLDCSECGQNCTPFQKNMEMMRREIILKMQNEKGKQWVD